MAYETGRRIVEMAYEDLRPSEILDRAAFLNAIRTVSAIGGSSNAQPHVLAMARHAGVALSPEDWGVHSHDIPLLVNMQPAGSTWASGSIAPEACRQCSGSCCRRASSRGCLTVTGRTLAENVANRAATDREVIRPYDQPLRQRAGFVVLKGNLFDFAIMKTSVISEEFRARYLCELGREGMFEGRAVVFDGSEDYHQRINDPALGVDARTILVIRGSGPLGWPGSAEVVNMQPPDALIQAGITSLPTLGDGRQSGTSDSPSILNASPESAAGGGLTWLRTGDVIRIDLNTGRCDALVEESEIAPRRAEAPPRVPESHTPWEELYREKTSQLAEGGSAGDGPEVPRCGDADATTQSLTSNPA